MLFVTNFTLTDLGLLTLDIERPTTAADERRDGNGRAERDSAHQTWHQTPPILKLILSGTRAIGIPYESFGLKRVAVGWDLQCWSNQNNIQCWCQLPVWWMRKVGQKATIWALWGPRCSYEAQVHIQETIGYTWKSRCEGTSTIAVHQSGECNLDEKGHDITEEEISEAYRERQKICRRPMPSIRVASSGETMQGAWDSYGVQRDKASSRKSSGGRTDCLPPESDRWTDGRKLRMMGLGLHHVFVRWDTSWA